MEVISHFELWISIAFRGQKKSILSIHGLQNAQRLWSYWVLPRPFNGRALFIDRYICMGELLREHKNRSHHSCSFSVESFCVRSIFDVNQPNSFWQSVFGRKLILHNRFLHSDVPIWHCSLSWH